MQALTWEQSQALIRSEIEEFRKIKSGVHMGMLATTRGGKTTLATGGKNGDGLLSHFEDVLVLDSTGDPGFIKDYGKPLNKYGGIHGHRRLSVSDMREETRVKIAKAILKAKRQGNIAIYADELRQLVDPKFFNLGRLFDDLWLFTAKKGVSVIGGSQAPRWLPGAFYDQVKMSFIFGVRDIRTRKRLMEIAGGFDSKELDGILPRLQRYEFAHVTIDGDIVTSKYELKKKPKPAEKSEGKRIRIAR